jgi:N-acetylmuramoyl-L-alanine amidase
MWGNLKTFHRWALVCATALGLASGPAGAATVLDVRAGIHGQTTRIVFEINEQVDFRAYPLPDPYRVVVDFPELAWNLPRPAPTNTGQLRKLDHAAPKIGASRVVLDTSGPVTVDKAFFIPPGAESRWYRLVLDLVPASRETVLAAMPRDIDAPVVLRPPAASTGTPTPPVAPPPASAPAAPSLTPAAILLPPAPPKPPMAKAKRVIVIDPGHGGVDPGALGVSGVYEKDVTLGVALAMRDAFQKSGRYTPVLTRDKDQFIALRDRVVLARDAGAQLFISIHANAIKDARVRGLSVYTLSEKASDQEAALLAEKENKADLIAGIDLSKESSEVTNILIDLAQREAMNQSARFASLLVKELAPTTSLLPNSHRFAGFAVLKAPDVPSVLVEVGFLSNKQDEQSLSLKRYRDKLASSTLEAVDAYFSRVDQGQKR